MSELTREHGAPGDRFPTPAGSHRRLLGGCVQGPSGAGSAPFLFQRDYTWALALSPHPAGLHCSWTSTGRSPGCSEATSSWCPWGMTSDMTSPRSGMPSSSTTSGSSTSSTASLTSTCRWEGAPSWGGGPGGVPRSAAAWPGRLPAPSYQLQGRGLCPTLGQGSPFYVRIHFWEPQRLRVVQQGRMCSDCLCVGRIPAPSTQPQHLGATTPRNSGTDGSGFGGISTGPVWHPL